MIESKERLSSNRVTDRTIRRRLLVGLLVAALTLGISGAAVVPFFFMGVAEDGTAAGLRMPATHDMFLHYDQMKSFYAGLASGEVYPRWEEDTNRGFGAPTTSFYPPGVYYVTGLGYALAHNWTAALLWAQWLMMLGSAAAIYWYARRAMSRGGAIVAMAAYVLGPYHLLDQYQRGAIAELLGFIWMPLMLGAGERLMKKEEGEKGSRAGKGRSWARIRSRVVATGVLGLSYGAFIWSHPPTAYQFSLAFGVAMAVLAVMKREWRGLLWIAAGLALGVGLAAAYIIPAAAEQNFIHKEYITGSWPYHNTYVFVHDIFNKDRFVDFYRRIDWLWGLTLGLTIVTGVSLTIAAGRQRSASAMAEDRPPGWRKFGSCLDAYLDHNDLLGPELKQRVLMWTILGLFVSFMMHKVSEPIGKHIPKIDIGIFTWRMLAISSLATALLAGACWDAGKKALLDQRKRRGAMFAGLSLTILAGSIAFSLLFVCMPMIRAPLFVPESEHMNYATLPAAATGDPEELPDDVPQAELSEEDNGEVLVERWEPEHRQVRAALEEADRLWIRTFNFPGWTATVDGKPADISTGEDLGDIQIDLAAGTHEIRVDFLDTPVRRNAEHFSVVTFAFIVLSMVVVAIFARRGQAEPAEGKPVNE